jgi:hypothetical protein
MLISVDEATPLINIGPKILSLPTSKPSNSATRPLKLFTNVAHQPNSFMPSWKERYAVPGCYAVVDGRYNNFCSPATASGTRLLGIIATPFRL